MTDVQTKALIFNGDNIGEINDLLAYFGHTLSTTTRLQKVYDDLTWAENVTKELLYSDQIHGETDFETIDPDAIEVFTKEGRYILKAEIEWNRHDKQYYFIESITFSQVNFIEGEKPKALVKLDDRVLTKGEVIVVNVYSYSIFNHFK